MTDLRRRIAWADKEDLASRLGGGWARCQNR